MPVAFPLLPFPKGKNRMSKLMNCVKAFSKEEDGATAVEYGIMVALIAVVIIGGVTLLGEGIDGVFTRITTAISTLAT
jgi:pilus assembly protein Flp/PilA